MSAIPVEQRGITAKEVGEMLGCTDRNVRERLACKPAFPKAFYAGGAPRWIYGEIIAYRESTRGGRQARRRKSRNTAKGFSDLDGR